MSALLDLPLRADGAARAALRELDGVATVHDVYDVVGSAIYDDLAQLDRHEVPELTRALRHVRGPVLELAAGSGRLTLPLLALGLEVHALDLSASMLDLLGERLESVPQRMRERCHPVQGDMAAFELPQTFDAVVLGTTSVSLLTPPARRSMLRCVARHLAPDGVFLLSTVARTRSDASEPDVLRGASGRTYRLFEEWPDSTDACTIVIVPDPDQAGGVQVCTSVVNVVDTAVLEAELQEAGLVVTATHPLAPAGAGRTAALLETRAAR